MAERQMTPVRDERATGRMPTSEWGVSPFRTLQRFAHDMDRMFEDFGLGRRGRELEWGDTGAGAWAPQVDVLQKGDQFIIKADLPGLSKDDVSVDIAEDALTIRGERKFEHEEQREGYYQTERSYGSFARVIPLPTGAMSDQAKATFRNGVLEIVMPSPPAATRGRRLEITEGVKK